MHTLYGINCSHGIRTRLDISGTTGNIISLGVGPWMKLMHRSLGTCPVELKTLYCFLKHFFSALGVQRCRRRICPCPPVALTGACGQDMHVLGLWPAICQVPSPYGNQMDAGVEVLSHRSEATLPLWIDSLDFRRKISLFSPSPCPTSSQNHESVSKIQPSSPLPRYSFFFFFLNL